jgi:hypothetical protein
MGNPYAPAIGFSLPSKAESRKQQEGVRRIGTAILGTLAALDKADKAKKLKVMD